MSLNITTKIESLDGWELPTSYGRVAVGDDVAGTSLQSILVIYKDEASFVAGKNGINTNLKLTDVTPYHRDIDGSDILDLAHDRLIALLTSQGITATKQL